MVRAKKERSTESEEMAAGRLGTQPVKGRQPA
jgi:hypothetical protein